MASKRLSVLEKPANLRSAAQYRRLRSGSRSLQTRKFKIQNSTQRNATQRNPAQPSTRIRGEPMKNLISRRHFIQRTALATAGVFYIARSGFAEADSPNEKLNIGVIGVANRGGDNLAGVAGQNIVALCDVDDNYLRAASQKFPEAKTCNDFRELLDQKEIDAVVISTADHTHAVATVMALRSGRHVYCEKPLTRTVSEARIVAETARETKRATQMGTQIHAGNNYRRVVELVKSGAIGPVREVHNWVGSVWSGHRRELTFPPIPAHLHYDLWLGPANPRPYSPAFIPAAWRGWWAFGGGALSDMACHHMDLPFWALDLRHPLTVEAEGPPVHPEFAPEWLIVRYEFPARENMPPVRLTWYNGDKRPPHIQEGTIPDWGGGTLFVGEKGMLLADYGRRLLLPEKDFAGFVPPEPFIPESIGHYEEWIRACKTGESTTCNFDYSGALTEAVLLGNVAYRTGEKLEWDPERLRARNSREASRFIRHRYRKGWKI
jgi:predicted dehydrogenase